MEQQGTHGKKDGEMDPDGDNLHGVVAAGAGIFAGILQIGTEQGSAVPGQMDPRYECEGESTMQMRRKIRKNVSFMAGSGMKTGYSKGRRKQEAFAR